MPNLQPIVTEVKEKDNSNVKDKNNTSTGENLKATLDRSVEQPKTTATDLIDQHLQKQNEVATKKQRKKTKKEKLASDVSSGKSRRKDVADQLEDLTDQLNLENLNVGGDDLLKQARDLLKRQGIELRYDPLSPHGGLILSKTKQLNIPGLNLNDLQYKITDNLLKPEDLEIFKWQSAEIFKDWENCILGGGKSRISNAAKHTDILCREKAISLRGDGRVADKVIPGLKYLPANVRELNFKTLLPIFNDPELKTFIAHLGRLCVGAPYSERDFKESKVGYGLVTDDIFYPTDLGFVSHRITHGYRYIAVINGDKGLGKTTLLKTLDSILYRCGYRSAAMARSNNQFNLAPALTDHMFASDMTLADIRAIQESSQIKELASGDYFSYEGKGENAITRRALAAITMFCNGISYPKRFDAGVYDRFHFLQTKSTKQLKNETGCSNLGLYWQRLAEKMDTTVEVLVVSLLRKSLDYFLEKNGYIWNEEKNGYDYNRDIAYTFDQIMSENQSKYAIQAPKDLTITLTRACRKALVLSKLANKELPHQFDCGFGIHHLLHCSNLLKHVTTLISKYEDKKEGKERHNKLSFLNVIKDWLISQGQFYDVTWRNFNQSVKDDIIANPHSDGLERWGKFIKKLPTTSGRIPPETLEYYDSAYRYQQTQEDSYIQEFKDLCAQYAITFDYAVAWLGLDIDSFA